MTTEITIADQSCALFDKSASGTFTFLGSAFFFKRHGRIYGATAAHCIPPTAATLRLHAASGEHEVALAAFDRPHDLCLLLPTAPPPRITAELSDDSRVQTNVTLCTYEYSTTEFRDDAWRLFPATRMGNCVRQPPLQDQFGEAGDMMLELSFPALRGASGAPVLQVEPGRLLVRGIIVANAERHLLPAQIETVLTDDNALLEERKYFLPQAVAVNSVHLCRLVDAYHTKPDAL